jgi:4'-phosphopantetheinyl transferase
MKHLFKAFQQNDCTLEPARIDIWQYPLNTNCSKATSLLNREEQARANRYHFERHQRRFTIARAMLRIILSKYINVSPQQLIFSENEYGKPYLTNYPEVQFNLSHSGELALLAVGYERPLGVDLEFFSDRPFTGIGNIMFSKKEITAFQGVPHYLQTLAFFHIWAQKEALIKACGLGLSYPTQAFDVPVLPSTNQLVWDAKHGQNWQMVSFQPLIRCCAALCYHSSVQTIRYQIIEPSLIL